MSVRSLLYLGCPPAEQAETEKLLAAASVSVVWADNIAYALSELQRNDMPVLLDLSRGAAVLQAAQTADAPILLRIERNAGHGGADLVKQQVERSADLLAFLDDQLR